MDSFKSDCRIKDRRSFLKKCFMGACGLAIGGYAVKNLSAPRRRAGPGGSGAGAGGNPASLSPSGRRFGPDANITTGAVSARTEPADKRASSAAPLPSGLSKWSREADWYEAVPGRAEVSCLLCPHQCILDENGRGRCRVRVARQGRLYTAAYGNPCAVHVDPIEKKPLYHFLPASRAFSIATAGCNLRCINCQNWEISQSRPEDTQNFDLPPGRVCESARQQGCKSIAYTYSEPLVFYEYVYDAAQLARAQGVKNVLVTAGYINPRPLRKLCKVIDAANIDLKGFSNATYRKLNSASLTPVLRTLEIMKEERIWIELGTLVVPAYSDDFDEIRAMTKWIVHHLGADTPFHLLRFYPAFKLTRLAPTPVDTMLRAYAVAKEAGLKFVYLGNLPAAQGQDTECPKCGRIVIERLGYRVSRNSTVGGSCPCGQSIAGVWA